MSARENRAAPGADTRASSGENRPATGRCTSATDAATPGTGAARPTPTVGGKQVLSSLWVNGLRSTGGEPKRPAAISLNERGIDDLPLTHAKRRRRKKGGAGVRYISGVHEQVENALRKKRL